MKTIIFGVLGLCFGSFVNAFVWRIKTKRNWVSERSMCVHCKHLLSAGDLLPVFSWVLLRGRCRYCHKKISAQYPLVELCGAVLFSFSFYFWPYNLVGIVPWILFFGWLVQIVLMLALAVYDFKWMLLPNKILYPTTTIAVGLVLICATIGGGGSNAIREAVFGVGVAFGFFYALFQLSNGKWIGGGDVKLGILIGLLVGGPIASMAVLFLASLFGTLFALPTLFKGSRTKNSKIPFGPFLILATIIIKIFGFSLISWYKHKVLLLS